MAYSFRHTDPQLTGVIVREKVRCGRQNCRCTVLNRLHKWYYYLYWRDYRNGAKLRKSYVPKYAVRKLRHKMKSKKVSDMQEKYKAKILNAMSNKLLGFRENSAL